MTQKISGHYVRLHACVLTHEHGYGVTSSSVRERPQRLLSDIPLFVALRHSLVGRGLAHANRVMEDTSQCLHIRQQFLYGAQSIHQQPAFDVWEMWHLQLVVDLVLQSHELCVSIAEIR